MPPVRLDVPERLSAELYDRAGAVRWDVSRDDFEVRLRTCLAHQFQGRQPAASEIERAARALHVEDLALAYACAAGHELAWDHFVREVRPALYAAARQMARTQAPQELADSIYADLFGLSARNGERRSLFDYYHGRARLTTWLRAVLAQRHVDAVRATARMTPLDEQELADSRLTEASDPDPYRRERMELVQRGLDGAISDLDARDRLRLRLYYGQGLKLAPIGRLLGESEATTSRKLERTRRDIRHAVRERLLAHGLPIRAIEELLADVAEAGEIEVRELKEK